MRISGGRFDTPTHRRQRAYTTLPYIIGQNAFSITADMDPLTQGLLGAAAAQAGFGQKLGRSAALIGMGAGMAADLDIFIRSAHDPVWSITMHRHFTHSLIFIPIGGLICALPFLFWPMFRHRRAAVIGAATLAYATHAPLDALTSYGTLLYWPFSNHRVALDVISIIDPIFTAALLLGVLGTLLFATRKSVAIGLVLAMLYVGLGFIQHERAMAVQRHLAQQRDHVIERGRVMPTLFNLILWRSVYEADGRLYADAIRAPLFQPTTVRTGHAAPLLRETDLPDSAHKRQTIERFTWFADGYVGVTNDGLIGDMRYSMDTSEFAPLWGLRVNPGYIRIEGHARDPERRGSALSRLWDDLRGRSADFTPVGH